jgi:hypothetical protein
MSDPSSLISKTVVLQSIQIRPELNGKIGTVESYLPDRERYLVHLTPAFTSQLAPPSANATTTMALKPDNLKVAGIVDKSKANVKNGVDLIKFLYKDERVWEEARRVYTSVEQSLPAELLARGITLQHVGCGLGLLFLVLVYLLGFSKCILLTSVLSLLIMTALPDLMTMNNGGATGSDGVGIKRVISNFPWRWRMTVEQNTGYTLTPKVANGILVVLLLVCGKLLTTPLSKPAVAPKEYSYLNDDASVSRSLTGKMALEDIYKLGFEDAQSSKEFGTSLPSDIDDFKVTSAMPSRPHPASYDGDFDYYQSPPPPPPPKKSKFGIGTLLSIFGLLRTVKDLGFVGGRFEPQMLVVNLKSLPPMRLALLGMCVYRIMSAFM